MFTIVSTAHFSRTVILLKMIDVCYNLFIIWRLLTRLWATRAVTTGSRATHKTPNCQHFSDLSPWSETWVLHQHHKPILFHPSSSAIDFLAPAYIKWASRPIKISIFSTPLQLLLEGQTDWWKKKQQQYTSYSPLKVWLVTQKPIQDLASPEVLSWVSVDWPVLNIYCSPTWDLGLAISNKSYLFTTFSGCLAICCLSASWSHCF